MNASSTEAVRYLTRQFETAWKLASYHLDGLGDEECLWRPARCGLHVHEDAQGRWLADWPDHEGYDVGPPSIAWLTWHMGFWWSMVLEHSFAEGALSREQVLWTGSAQAARDWLERLSGQWRAELDRLTDEGLRSERRTRWPFTQRPFGDVVAWVNVELTRNAAELGYARFLYSAHSRFAS